MDFLRRCARFLMVLVGLDTAAVFVGSTWAGVACGPDTYECPESVAIPVALAAITTLAVTLTALAREIDRSARARPARHLLSPPGSGSRPSSSEHGGPGATEN